VFRSHVDGRAVGDVIARADERLEGRPLLQIVMRAGRPMPAVTTSLDAIRRYAADEVARLPERVIAPAPADPPYPVQISPALERHHAHVRATAARE
jgi:nicotinate phosphoribosyltransferase